MPPTRPTPLAAAKERILKSPKLLCVAVLLMMVIVICCLLSIANEPTLVYKAF